MNRPTLTPEEWLARAKAEEEKEQQQTHGKLKIFFGAAPGVGKTYSMLQDAVQKSLQGLEVLVGVAESHGREDTQALLNNFEILPRKKIPYHGITLQEFDLDAAIERKPQLILVDEMAHTNAEGSRHIKRWQDIKELLDCGIDVYTTLNVQHVESLNDVIAQITGVRVRETVPDNMLETATIELVDLPPEDLLQRLQAGKVYFSHQAELAKDHFFREGNLIALRELALRITADRVNAQGVTYRQGDAHAKPWATTERLLVCVGPNANATKLIRAAKRMATSLRAPWMAAFVEGPRLNITDEQRQFVLQNLNLAEQLGAEAVTLSGRDMVNEIISFARSHNVTKIVLEKRIRSRWHDAFFGGLVNELVKNSGDIDIYIIGGNQPDPRQKAAGWLKRRSSWTSYLLAIGMVALCTVINTFLKNDLAHSNLMMIYLLGVMLIAIRAQPGPAMLASVLSVLTFDFLFIPPFYSFVIADTQYLIALGVMAAISQVISYYTLLTRRQAEQAYWREQRIVAMYSLSRQLATNRGQQKLLRVAVRYLGETFDSQVIVFMIDDSGRVQMRAKYRAAYKLSAKELGVAQWVADLGQTAGLGTQTLPVTRALYVPLIGTHKPLGVLHVMPDDPQLLQTPDRRHLLEALAHQIALALEVDKLQE